MRTAEEILYDELNDNHVKALESVPLFKEWVIDAMKMYAEQAIDECAERIHKLGLATCHFEGEDFIIVDPPEVILKLKDELK